MIVLFTDFGLSGPYVGQMKAVLLQQASGATVVDLFADAPRFNPRASAYLLAAYAEGFSEGTVFLGVVDPGVGSAARKPIIMRADGRWFVGPGNGLFNVVAQRSTDVECWEIGLRPPRLSASFHGRDLFAPAAAAIARGESPPGPRLKGPCFDPSWPEDLPAVVYIDHFGNAITGLRAAMLPGDTVLEVRGHRLRRTRTFSDVPIGSGPFWYENANGLAELALNQGSAAVALGLEVGTPVTVQPAG